ncbi:MAG: PKD domain-containing protein, partial [Xanthomonadales bacterium]|nr:PKD domain-containing protein [Xanthomonadales bacterium]
MSSFMLIFRHYFSAMLLSVFFLFSGSVFAQSDVALAIISGEASVVIVDQIDGSSELQYFVIDKINQRETRVFFNGQADPGFRTGRPLEVRGRGRANGVGLQVESILYLDPEEEPGSGGGTTQGAPVAAAETRNVLTLLVDFNDATVDSPTMTKGVSLQEAKDRMFNESKNVADFYYNASLTTLTIPEDPDGDGQQDVYGPYLIDDSYIGGDSAQCTASTWVSKASAAWEAANPGKDINIYRHRLLIVPNYQEWGNRHCTWGGVGQLGCGSWCWAIGADPLSILHGVIIHELGHNFNLHHASTDGDNNGSINSEYGDRSDQMGSSRNWMKFNTPHIEYKGWIDSIEYEIRQITPSSEVQSFDLISMDEEAWDWPGLRSVKFARNGSSSYYVSYRQQAGDYNNVTSSYTAGLNLHYRSNGSNRSMFIKVISPGETFVDAVANVSIKATSQMTISNGSTTTKVMGVEICDAVCSNIPPPGNLSATAVAIDMIDLAWQDNHDNEDGYNLERSDDGSSWSLIAPLGADEVFYTDSGLSTATQYSYRVQTVEAGEYSAYSNIASASTFALPPSAGFNWSADFTEASFTDTSSDSDGAVVSWSWDFGDSSGSSSQNPVHVFAAGGDYSVSLTATDNHGATDTTIQLVSVEDPPFVNFYASSETTSNGTLTGNMNATKADDGSTESITERESGGKPSKRHSLLGHRWSINIGAGGNASVVVNAWQDASPEGDTFDFQWSPDASNWTTMFNVDAISDPGTPQSFVLPAGASGTVYIRVEDTVRTQGTRNLDTVHVDLLMV